MVSILLCTIDRFDLAYQCIGRSLDNADYPYELLCVDNGSRDDRIIQYIGSLKPVYHRLNGGNGGYARMVNQMLLRASGDFFCVLDNDMLLPPGWAKQMVAANTAIPYSGISSVHLPGVPLPNIRYVNGIGIYPDNHILGTKFFSRAFVEKVGYFDEEFHPYGYEDIVMQSRATVAGLLNYYAMTGAGHFGSNGDAADYHRMKLSCVDEFASQFRTRTAQVKAGKFYTPPPLLS